jgi:hypothetical protein
MGHGYKLITLTKQQHPPSTVTGDENLHLTEKFGVKLNTFYF